MQGNWHWLPVVLVMAMAVEITRQDSPAAVLRPVAFDAGRAACSGSVSMLTATPAMLAADQHLHLF